MANRKKKQPLYRTQVLLEPEQHAALARLAEATDRSISQVVREAVADYLAAPAGGAARELREAAAAYQALEKLSPEEAEARRQRGRQALDDLARLRAQILEQWGGEIPDIDIADMINQMRDERDAEIMAAIEGRH